MRPTTNHTTTRAVCVDVLAQRERPWLEDLPAKATADESPPQPAAATGTHDSAAEQMWHVFHELHADGRNAQCAVCDSHYRTA